MKYVILVLFGFVSITSAFSADVSAYNKGWYVQPSAVYLFPKGDYKAGGGAAISAGYNFDKHHAVEVEFMSFKAETEEHFNSGYSYKTDLTSTPLLANYRYSFTVGKSFGLFGGVSIGTTRETQEQITNYHFPNTPVAIYKWDETNNRFLYGVQFGATYEFTQHISAIVAVKIIRAEGQEGPSGYTLGQLGLNCRF